MTHTDDCATQVGFNGENSDVTTHPCTCKNETMSREIKFRAWGKEAEKFFEPAPRLHSMTISITLNGEIIGHPNVGDVSSNYILMQFTGLHDWTGKEIYEGDVVRYKIKRMFWGEKESVITKTVEISEGLCNVSPTIIEAYEEGGAEDVGATVEYIEVIGNIYENPELTPQTNEQR